MAEIQRDLTRSLLAVIFIVVLIGSSNWILRPFLAAVWAATIVVAAWETVDAAKIQDAAAKIAPYAGELIKWFVSQVGGFGMLLVEFLLTVILSAIMYANGESAAQRILSFGRRLAGPSGENAVRLAGQALRGVALGIVVTAVAQSVLGGLSPVIAGVPFAAILTAVMLMPPSPGSAFCRFWDRRRSGFSGAAERAGGCFCLSVRLLWAPWIISCGRYSSKKGRICRYCSFS